MDGATVGEESGGGTRLNEKLGYVYDAAGNLQYRTNNALIQTFAVNELNQLSNITRSGTLTISGATSTNASSVTVNGSSATLYDDRTFAKDGLTTTNGVNAYTAAGSDSLGRSASDSITVNLPSTASFSYDANGSLTNDGIWTFVYDGENRLCSMTMTNVASVANSNRCRLEFQYDYLGRRVWKKVSTWNGSSFTAQSTNIYIYDGYNLIADLDGGAPLDPLPLRRSFTWGLDMTGTLDGASGVGGYLMIVDHVPVTDTIHYAAHDGNANVMALVNSAGDISARYEYGPFHEVIRATGPMSRINCTTSSDRYTDWETGLVYHYGRYYSPILGRWINEDPVEEDGGNNLYAFVGNNPVTMFDALGTTTGTVGDTTAGTSGAAAMSGSGAQVIGLLTRVRNAVETFNDIQEFTSDILEAAEGDPSDLMMTLLQASAQTLAKRLVGSGAKLGVAAAASGSTKKFEMHHIFPQRADLKKQFEAAGINIHEWKVRLERNVHKGIHQGGARGGDWNDDWTKFLKGKPKSPTQMFDFAIELMQKYGVNASQLK